MSKPKSKKSKAPAKAKAKHQPKPRNEKAMSPEPQNPDCPYKVGTLYGTLFTEGNQDYISKAELIKKVAEITGKPIRSVEFAYQVLKSPGHRSNKGRSTELTEGDKVKLIANRPNH